jgi:hypothetical protein
VSPPLANWAGWNGFVDFTMLVRSVYCRCDRSRTESRSTTSVLWPNVAEAGELALSAPNNANSSLSGEAAPPSCLRSAVDRLVGRDFLIA